MIGAAESPVSETSGRSRTRIKVRALAPFVHPLLLAVYPVVFLWARNVAEHPPVIQIVGALAMMLGLAVAVFVVLRIVIKDTARAAIATSIVVSLFGLFGRAEVWLLVPSGSVLESTLLVALGLLIIAMVVVVKKSQVGLEHATPGLNVLAVTLVAMNLTPFFLGVPVLDHAGAVAAWPLSVEGLSPVAVGPARDVYYLIFDRYANERTLRDLYGFDNSAFLAWLQDHGFDVIHDALANYPQTTHSLASSLNMTYLDKLAEEVGPDTADWGPLRASLSATTTSRTFQQLGYRYEHIGSWWTPTAVDPTADDNFTFGGVPEFTRAFRNVTGWGAVLEKLGLGPNDFREQWNRVPFQTSALEHIAMDSRPTFTFAHFTLPHPPYVFHADGSFAAPDPSRSRVDAYVDQLRYTNTVVESVVTDLLTAPGPAPIIVIQSDEGPHPPDLDGETQIFREPWGQASDVELGRKLRILNAFYLPGGVKQPEPTITPVNTFRLILDDYFGADLPLLSDRTDIFIDYEHPYQFADVTERLRGG